MLASFNLFAEEDDENFTWSEYEMYCYSIGVEPTQEDYEYLCKNPQCYGEDESVLETGR